MTAAELQASDVRFRHMVEAVKDYAIFTVEAGGYITSWNEGCIRMKQYTADDAVGQHFSMLYPEEGRRRDEPTAHLRAAAIEGRFRGEVMKGIVEAHGGVVKAESYPKEGTTFTVDLPVDSRTRPRP